MKYKIKFGDIEDAFLFVSSTSYGMNSAILKLTTGKIYYISDMAGEDETENDPDFNWDDTLGIPHKNDLGLGRDMIFEFVSQSLPDDEERVQSYFRKRGAYSLYKELLEKRGLLQKWYDYESKRESDALRQWCEENDINPVE